MIIFKDKVSGDELLSDTFRYEVINDVAIKVKGKLITENCDIDESAIGGNASAEGGDEGISSSERTGVNIVMNHSLTETSFDKKSYTTYVKSYVKKIKERLIEEKSDRVEVFQKNIQEYMKLMLGKFKDLSFYMGEKMDPEGMVILCDWEEEIPCFYYIKDGMDEEKV